jgi:acetyl-CoA carboxylase carboxyl transferase subunit alpha
MKLVDEIIPEPLRGAHTDGDKTAASVKTHLLKHLEELMKLSPAERLKGRYDKFRAFGHFEEKIESAENDVPQAGPASA